MQRNVPSDMPRQDSQYYNRRTTKSDNKTSINPTILCRLTQIRNYIKTLAIRNANGFKTDSGTEAAICGESSRFSIYASRDTYMLLLPVFRRISKEAIWMSSF